MWLAQRPHVANQHPLRAPDRDRTAPRVCAVGSGPLAESKGPSAYLPIPAPFRQYIGVPSM
jgi:hypothetical protein